MKKILYAWLLSAIVQPIFASGEIDLDSIEKKNKKNTYYKNLYSNTQIRLAKKNITKLNAHLHFTYVARAGLDTDLEESLKEIALDAFNKAKLFMDDKKNSEIDRNQVGAYLGELYITKSSIKNLYEALTIINNALEAKVNREAFPQLLDLVFQDETNTIEQRDRAFQLKVKYAKSFLPKEYVQTSLEYEDFLTNEVYKDDPMHPSIREVRGNIHSFLETLERNSYESKSTLYYSYLALAEYYEKTEGIRGDNGKAARDNYLKAFEYGNETFILDKIKANKYEFFNNDEEYYIYLLNVTGKDSNYSALNSLLEDDKSDIAIFVKCLNGTRLSLNRNNQEHFAEIEKLNDKSVLGFALYKDLMDTRIYKLHNAIGRYLVSFNGSKKRCFDEVYFEDEMGYYGKTFSIAEAEKIIEKETRKLEDLRTQRKNVTDQHQERLQNMEPEELYKSTLFYKFLFNDVYNYKLSSSLEDVLLNEYNSILNLLTHQGVPAAIDDYILLAEKYKNRYFYNDTLKLGNKVDIL